MPNQTNFVSLIPANPQSVSISRIAESENDTDILQARIPAEFGFDADDNVELHFYDSTNTLVNSTIVPISTGIVSVRTVLLPDNQREEKLVIDMTRLQTELGLFLPPATYTLSINLFSNEIGTYADKKLNIEEVSTSRTELRLGFNVEVTDTEIQEIFEFVEPSIPRMLASGLIGGIVGVGQNDIITGQIAEPAQEEQFINDVNEELMQIIPNLADELSQVEPTLQDDLNQTISLAGAAVYDEFVQLLSTTKDSNVFDRLQAQELDVLIEQAVSKAFSNTNLGLYVNGKIQLI